MSIDRDKPPGEYSGQAPDRNVGSANQQNLIDESHQRSKSYGIERTDEPDFSPLVVAKLSRALTENKFLLQHATPVMETLYGQIVNTDNMVLLTSSEGLVLHTLGDRNFLEKATQVALLNANYIAIARMGQDVSRFLNRD